MLKSQIQHPAECGTSCLPPRERTRQECVFSKFPFTTLLKSTQEIQTKIVKKKSWIGNFFTCKAYDQVQETIGKLLNGMPGLPGKHSIHTNLSLI